MADEVKSCRETKLTKTRFLSLCFPVSSRPTPPIGGNTTLTMGYKTELGPEIQMGFFAYVPGLLIN